MTSFVSVATQIRIKMKPKPKASRKQTWCIFSQVPADVANRFLTENASVESEKSTLSTLFNLSTFQGPLRSIILELYHKVLVFGKHRESKFDAKKLSTFLGIFDTAFKKAARKDISQEKFYNHFKELLLNHSVQRPPYSLCVFSADDVKNIADFFVETIYKYYPLYKYLLHPRYELTFTSDSMFKVDLPQELSISLDMNEIKPQDIPDLKKFFQQTPEEKEAEIKAKEIAEILVAAKVKLEKEMEERMKKQDDDFVNEVKTLEKK